MTTPRWEVLPFEYPSPPVVAIALETGGVWAGGLGGAAPVFRLRGLEAA